MVPGKDRNCGCETGRGGIYLSGFSVMNSEVVQNLSRSKEFQYLIQAFYPAIKNRDAPKMHYVKEKK